MSMIFGSSCYCRLNIFWLIVVNFISELGFLFAIEAVLDVNFHIKAACVGTVEEVLR